MVFGLVGHAVNCYGCGGLASGCWNGFQLGCGLFQLDGYAYFHDINYYILWVVCESVNLLLFHKTLNCVI